MVEPQPSKLIVWVRFSSSAPLDNSVRTIRTLNRNQSQKDWFFCCIKNQPTLKRKVGEKIKHYKMYKSIMKYLIDKDLSLNVKAFLSMILFNDEIHVFYLMLICYVVLV